MKIQSNPHFVWHQKCEISIKIPLLRAKMCQISTSFPNLQNRNKVYWKKIVVLASWSFVYYVINVYVPRVRANAYHMLTTPETPKCAYVIYGQPLIQPLAWIVFTSNISIVCILKKKVCSHICTTSWRTSLNLVKLSDHRRTIILPRLGQFIPSLFSIDRTNI